MTSSVIAFLFPGQGSQLIGMGYKLSLGYPSANRVFQEADDILNFSLSTFAWKGPEQELNDTINTQPALLTHSIAAWVVLLEHFPHLVPSYVAGHSMGELSALVAAKSMTFHDALLLVRRRGELMKRSGIDAPGGMAAILGLDIPTLDSICMLSSRSDALVQVANDNCPGQIVISGAEPALERALSMAKMAGARKVVRLPVSIAAHSSLMNSAQLDFNKAVNSAQITNPKIPIISNLDAKPLLTSESIRDDLQDQLTHRVRWADSIQYMVHNGVNTFIEIGSGSVLTGLVKRINRQVKCLSFGEPDDFASINSSI